MLPAVLLAAPLFPGFLIDVLIALIIVGLLLYVVSILPIDATIKQIIKVIVIVVVVIWLLYLLLPLASLPPR